MPEVSRFYGSVIQIYYGDLVGFPIRVTIGEKSLAKGGVEVRTRATGETKLVPVAEAMKTITSVLKA